MLIVNNSQQGVESCKRLLSVLKSSNASLSWKFDISQTERMTHRRVSHCHKSYLQSFIIASSIWAHQMLGMWHSHLWLHLFLKPCRQESTRRAVYFHPRSFAHGTLGWTLLGCCTTAHYSMRSDFGVQQASAFILACSAPTSLLLHQQLQCQWKNQRTQMCNSHSLVSECIT